MDTKSEAEKAADALMREPRAAQSEVAAAAARRRARGGKWTAVGAIVGFSMGYLFAGAMSSACIVGIGLGAAIGGMIDQRHVVSPRLLWLVPLAIGLTSTALYFRQGGFGAGHGEFDRVLYLLAMPWSLVPWPESFFRTDLVWLIVVPFLLNALLVALVTSWLRKRGRQKSSARVAP